MNTISCLIIDDEPNAVKLLADYIQKVPFLLLRHTCFDAFEAAEFLQKEPVDLLFLDINMPQMSGMELAALLPKSQLLIFTTAYSSHALEGYEFNAIDYLLKPITFKRFMQAISKARYYFSQSETGISSLKIASPNTYIFIKSGKQVIKIEYKSILYLEAHKEYVNIVSRDNQNLVYKRMKTLEEELPPDFIRIHNSYIINLDHLEKIVENHVIIGKARLPVSNSYRAALTRRVEEKLL